MIKNYNIITGLIANLAISFFKFGISYKKETVNLYNVTKYHLFWYECAMRTVFYNRPQLQLFSDNLIDQRTADACDPADL